MYDRVDGDASTACRFSYENSFDRTPNVVVEEEDVGVRIEMVGRREEYLSYDGLK